jgi:predicted DNA-binding transcriptional regulator AlpA
MPEKSQLQDRLAYAPRLLRVERAAAYCGMTTTSFRRLVAEGRLPKPKRLNGIAAWDRYRLDAAIDDVDDDVADNTVAQLLRKQDD